MATDGPPIVIGPNKLAQFTMTDRKFLIQDVEFWASTVDAMLQFYKETLVTSPEDLAAKAIACGRLAGLGHAMAAHFESGVDSCIDTTLESDDVEACVDAGERVFGMCEKHTTTLEERAKKAIS